MVPGMFTDSSFEKAAKKAGKKMVKKAMPMKRKRK